MPADQKQVADAAFFLGSSLYEQGKYKESAAALQTCLQIRPDDPTVLNNAATSLMLAGNYAGAEPLFRRALAINEKAQGTDHPLAATILANLGVLLRAKATTRVPSHFTARPWRLTRKLWGQIIPT